MVSILMMMPGTLTISRPRRSRSASIWSRTGLISPDAARGDPPCGVDTGHYGALSTTRERFANLSQLTDLETVAQLASKWPATTKTASSFGRRRFR